MGTSGTSARGNTKNRAGKRPATRRRAPGRPPLDAPDQRARLIDAALACYVSQGIAATSIRDIARHAGVTPALVHYYFGDAQRLRERVIQERLMPVFHRLREAMSAAGEDDPAALARAFVDALCQAIDAHPWWPALWVREVISEGGSLRDLLITRVAPELPRGLAGRFAAAQAEGRLNRGLDPRLLVVTLIGLTLFPAAGAPIWRRIFAAEDLTMDHVRSHALALLGGGLEGQS